MPELEFTATPSDDTPIVLFGVRSGDADYADAREAIGTILATVSAQYMIGQYWNGSIHEIYQSFLQFDTSTIPDDATIVSARLILRALDDFSTTDFILEARAHDWGGTIQTTDFVAGSALSGKTLCATFNSADFVAATDFEMTSAPGFAGAINKTGWTRFVLASDRQRTGTAPTTSERFRISSTASLHRLQVTYIPHGITQELLDSTLSPVREPEVTIEINGTPFVVAQGTVSIDQNDGETAGTASATIRDAAGVVQQWDEVQIFFGFNGVQVPRFFGQVNDFPRPIRNAAEGATISISCVGQTAEILQLVVSTNKYDATFTGFGAWHAGGWTRSEILQDLCLQFNISPFVIEATTTVVVQNPYTQRKLADIMADIALPERGKFRFDASGTFRFFTVSSTRPNDWEISEGETVTSVEPRDEHQKIINEVLVIGTGVDPRRIIKPAGEVGVLNQQISAGQVFTGKDITISEAVVEPALTHTTTITGPSSYAIANNSGTENTNNPGQTYQKIFPFPPAGGSGQLTNVKDVLIRLLRVNWVTARSARHTVIIHFTDATYHVLLDYWSGGPNPIVNVQNYDVQAVHGKNVEYIEYLARVNSGTVGGTLTVIWDIDYRQIPEVGPTVTVTKRNDLITAQQTVDGTTLKYFADIASTFLFDTVQLKVVVQGRAVEQEAFPIIRHEVNDPASITDFGSRTVEIEASSINDDAAAASLAGEILAAGKDPVRVFTIVCGGHPGIFPADKIRLYVTSPRPQIYLGASLDLYVQAVRDEMSISDRGKTWRQTLRCIAQTRSILSIVRNFGINPIKERASAQAEVMKSTLTGQIETVEVSAPLIPGEADRQRYAVRMISIRSPLIHDVGNATSEQFVVGDTVLLQFRNGDRSQAVIGGRSDRFMPDGVDLLP